MSAPSLPPPNLGYWRVQDVLYKALRAAQIVKRAQGIPSSSQFAEALLYANQIIDQWAARRVNMWTTTFTLYTLTPNHQPHMLGPGLIAPDFACAAPRPVRIESAELVLTGLGGPGSQNPTPPTPPGAVNTNVDLPLHIRDSAWWANRSLKGIATDVPTDLYVEYDWDSLALYLWCIPSYAYGLRLESWVGLSQFQTIAAKFSAPPAYFNALAYTLAKALLDPFEMPMPAALPDLLREAMRAMTGNNQASPRCSSADYGTRGRTGRGDFNYFTGTMP
jgi:hypothetical protein